MCLFVFLKNFEVGMSLVQKLHLWAEVQKSAQMIRRKVRRIKTEVIKTDRVKRKQDVFADFAKDDGEMKRGLFCFFGGRRVDLPPRPLLSYPPGCPEQLQQDTPRRWRCRRYCASDRVPGKACTVNGVYSNCSILHKYH